MELTDKVLINNLCSWPLHFKRLNGMYVSYLQRELSRVMALNSIYGKDIQIAGTDATKRVTKLELEHEISRVNERLHKMKQHCFD